MSAEDPHESAEPQIPGAEILRGTFNFNPYNIPVNLGVYPETDKGGEPTGSWILSSGNYAPVNDELNLDIHVVKSQDPEILRKLVRERVIPIYETALAQLRAIADDEADYFHAWDRETRAEEQAGS